MHIRKDRPAVLILGAGVVGVATAYSLNRLGLDVAVVDRMPGAGLDTSFANGGQISVAHAEPWANPSAPLKVLKWLARDDSPLLFRPRLDLAQWRWMAGWLFECLPWRARANTVAILEAALHSRTCLQEIRAREGLSYDQETRGILHFYRDRREFEAAVPVAELMSRAGLERRVVDRDEAVRLEPALAEGADAIVGGTYTPTDESGDAHVFTRRLAEIAASRGVRFLYQREVAALEADRTGRRILGVSVKDLATGRYERMEAGAYVLAMGSFSPLLARPIGLNLPIYPAKGYSVTIPVGDGDLAPRVSLTDDEFKLVYSRLGDRLRVAGTAELSGYGRELDMTRCRAILDNVRGLFPRAGRFEEATFWTGLRPTTPSNVPHVGGSSYGNLWLNTGHGTLGWTLAAGSGERVAAGIAAALGTAGAELPAAA